MRKSFLLCLASLAVPSLAWAAGENVTPRLRGALVEFESGTIYKFHPRGHFVVQMNGTDYSGKWAFKEKNTFYCVTVTLNSGPETWCNSIVKHEGSYSELGESGEAVGGPIKDIKFNRFRR